MYNLIPLMVLDGRPVLSYVLSTLLVNIILSYFSYGRALDFRRIVYVTWLSIVSYTIWLGLVIYAHTKGTLQPEPGWLGSSKLWPGLGAIRKRPYGVLANLRCSYCFIHLVLLQHTTSLRFFEELLSTRI